MFTNNKRQNCVLGCLYAIAIIAVAVLVSNLGAFAYRAFDKAYDLDTVTYTVTDKDPKSIYDTEKYLIYCTDDNNDIKVLEITDSLMRGRFNSPEIYAGIEVGKKYKFVTGGGQNDFFSWYPNIYEYTEIGGESQ